MPLNEGTQKTRERWPAEFDITGVPRDNQLRSRLLAEQRLIDAQAKPMPPMSTPFPKLLYHADGRILTVQNEEALSLAEAAGFERKPSPRYDYSQIKHGVAELKPESLPEVVEISPVRTRKKR